MRTFSRFALYLLLTFIPSVSTADSKSDVAEYYETALTYFEDEKFPSAIISLKNALQIDLKHLPSRILLGKAYVKSRNGISAEKELMIAREMGADENLTAIPLAQALNLQFKYDKIIELFSTKKFPEFVKIPLNFELGQAYLLTNEIEKANQVYEEILTESPWNSFGLRGRALVLLAQGKLEAAQEIAFQANKAATDKTQTTYLLARLAVAQDRPETALEYFNEVIRLNPGHYSARMDRAYNLIQQHEYQGAIKDLEILVEKVPYDAKSHYLMGVAYRDSGNMTSALNSFNLAEDAIADYTVAIQKKDGPTLLLAAAIALAKDKPKSALDFYEAFLAKNPENLNIKKVVAKLHINSGEAYKAVGLIKKMDIEQYQDAELYMILGEAYTQLNQHKEASTAFEQAMLLNPQQPAIQAMLGKSQILTGESGLGFENLENMLNTKTKSRKVGIFLAMQYFREGKLEDAKRVTSSMLEQDANNLSALSLHASIVGSLGDLKQARQLFEKILEINPDFRSARLNLIKVDLNEGKEQQARNSMVELLKKQPDDNILLYEQVKLEEATGNIELASRLIEKLFQKSPKDVTITLHLIKLYAMTGRALEATEIGSKLHHKNPKDTRIMEYLGKAYIEADDEKSARLMFKRMSREVGSDATQLFRIALLQVSANDLEQARWTLQKSIDSQPNFYTAIATLTELQIQTGRLESADELITRLKNLAPDNPTSSLLKGNLAAKKGNNNAALKAYSLAHKRMDSAKTVILLFKTLLTVGETQKAIKLLSSWTQSHPEREDFKMMLADIHYQTGNIKKAVKYYEKLVAEERATGLAYSRLALVYAKTRKDTSLTYAKKAYALSPDNVIVSDTYGWLLTLNGQPKEGLSLLRDAVSRNSTSPEIHYHLAVALEKLEQTKKAIREYETALSFKQQFTGINDARQNLQKLKTPPGMSQ